ncbi:MAG: arylesterase [Deltaproteobacteria bacterium]|nr:MAG: arylesterase [Deltaproteobacteria bacterium]
MNHSAVLKLLSLIITLVLLYGCGKDTPKLPKLSEDAVILAFGDSLTYGTGAKSGESYPAILENLSGKRIVNAGIPGELSAKGLQRLSEVLNEHEPELLLLCHGGNDLLRRHEFTKTATNLKKMVLMARERCVSVVLIGVPRPGFILKTADFYTQIAEEMELPFEGGILEKILSDRELKSDTTHPNSKGYCLMAEAVHKLLKQTGAL